MFGDRLRELREDKKMSQRILAETLGVTQQAVGKWETGKSEPDNATIKKLADILETSSDYLLGITDNPTHVKDRELPQTVAPYLPEGFDELSPEAKEEVLNFIDYIMVKYGKGKDKK